VLPQQQAQQQQQQQQQHRTEERETDMAIINGIPKGK
jgi:hypothetical protein